MGADLASQCAIVAACNMDSVLCLGHNECSCKVVCWGASQQAYIVGLEVEKVMH